MSVKLLSDTHAATITDDDQLRIDEILAFWFMEKEANTPKIDARMDVWFGENKAFDEQIAKEFADDVERASAGDLDHWARDPNGRLALILLLDQFRRNIYRNTPEAFARDNMALKLCVDGVSQKMDKALQPVQRVFFYMPMQHAESVKVQDKSVKIYRRLADSVSETQKETFGTVANFAELHADIVRQFGRFPHRNNVLGRANTPEEDQYLAGDIPTFGQSDTVTGQSPGP